MSNLEDKIAAILRRYGIEYEREKEFPDFRGGKYRFDFYLPKFKVCIECDGVQHFTYQKHFFKTREAFMAQKERDRRKNSYCLSKKIRLYRIPYTDIPQIKEAADIFKKEYLVTSKWHNDNIINSK